MEPRIQYAKTSDGVSIAFWTMGEGMPFVHMPWGGISNTQAEWELSDFRSWYERLAAKWNLVRYDPRGAGLSDRDVSGFSVESYLLDVDAVAKSLSLDRFVLFAPMHSGPAAIAYAVSRPERVSHLVLWCSWASAADFYGSPEAQALLALRDKDWDTYSQAVAHAFTGWSEGGAGSQLARLIRESFTQDELLAAFSAGIGTADATALLPRVGSPTLVMNLRQFRLVGMNLAKGLASQISGARLVVLDGESAFPVGDVAEAAISAIDEFLGEGEEAAVGTEPALGGMVTILFTDMEGSTSLTQRLGDAKAQEVLRTHNGIVREALKGHGGSEIKHTGDGIMASFASASGGLDCAVQIQRALAQRNDERPGATIHVRIGLNVGEPVRERGDLFGTAVQLARRICDQAEAGQILVSNVVRELVAGKGFLFADQGETALRGFEDPVRLFEVRWTE